MTKVSLPSLPGEGFRVCGWRAGGSAEGPVPVASVPVGGQERPGNVGSFLSALELWSLKKFT